LSGAVAKLASITFLSLAFSYWFDKPWFHNWGKTCCCAHHTFLLGFPTGCYLHTIITLQKRSRYITRIRERKAESTNPRKAKKATHQAMKTARHEQRMQGIL
jgi:hypothetical protein